MKAIEISKGQMKKSFFDNMRYCVWNTYDYDNYFEFLHRNGIMYRTKYSKILEENFDVIKYFNKSDDFYEKWFWHYMEMGGGVVFIHKEIAENYKKYAGIEGKFKIDGPNWDAAIKAIEELKMVITKELLDNAIDYKNDGWIYLGNDIERYFLGKPKENNLLIFGINPSTATMEKLDNTMNKIVKIIDNSKEFSNFGWIMMNIYPQRTPHPEELEFNENMIENNIKTIEFICRNFVIKNVWCAWGNYIDNSGKKFLYKSLKSIYGSLKIFNLNFYNYGNITKKNNPQHPLSRHISVKDNFYKFDIVNYLNLK